MTSHSGALEIKRDDLRNDPHAVFSRKRYFYESIEDKHTYEIMQLPGWKKEQHRETKRIVTVLAAMLWVLTVGGVVLVAVASVLDATELSNAEAIGFSVSVAFLLVVAATITAFVSTHRAHNLLDRTGEVYGQLQRIAINVRDNRMMLALSLDFLKERVASALAPEHEQAAQVAGRELKEKIDRTRTASYQFPVHRPERDMPPISVTQLASETHWELVRDAVHNNRVFRFLRLSHNRYDFSHNVLEQLGQRPESSTGSSFQLITLYCFGMEYTQDDDLRSFGRSVESCLAALQVSGFVLWGTFTANSTIGLLEREGEHQLCISKGAVEFFRVRQPHGQLASMWEFRWGTPLTDLDPAPPVPMKSWPDADERTRVHLRWRCRVTPEERDRRLHPL